MIKKTFWKFYPEIRTFGMFEGSQTENFGLGDLWTYLRSKDPDTGVYMYEEGDMMVFFDRDLIKQQELNDVYYPNHELELKYHATYGIYASKRWDDVPKFYITKANYAEIEKKWKQLHIDKPAYVILSQDESGYVDLIGKEELSPEDLRDMQYENQQFLRYQKAYEKYMQANPYRSEKWRSPADEEYEADWQKYLDQD